MNKQDIDKASSALTGAINYFSPVVVALNQADEIFSVLSNAVKLQEVMERDVAALKSTAATLTKQVEDSKAAIVNNKEIAAQAQTQADKDVADAKAQATAAVAEIKASVADRTKKAIADSEAKIAAATQAAQEAHSAHAETIASLVSTKSELEISVAALDKKLAALKEQAQKFAASLAE